MLGNDVIPILFGPVGIMLAAAAASLLVSLLSWRAAARYRKRDTLAELFTPETLATRSSDPKLNFVPPRAYRRATRDQGPVFASKGGHAYRSSIPLSAGTEKDRGIVLEATRHLAREGLLVVSNADLAKADEHGFGQDEPPMTGERRKQA